MPADDIHLTTAADFENELYGVRDVVAARVSGERDAGEIRLLVRPESDHDAVITGVRELVRSTGAAFDRISLRIIPIGTAEETTVLELRPEAPSAARARRLRLRTVTTVAEEAGVTVEVVVTDGTAEARGEASGWRGSAALPVIVGRATIDALSQLRREATEAYLESAQVLDLAGVQVAVVLVVLPNDGHDDVLAGAGVLRTGDRADGIARAVLDATNRRLERSEAARSEVVV